MHYIISFNPKLHIKYILLSLFIIISLILFANLDYSNRIHPSDQTIYSTPHYIFTILTYFILFYIVILTESKTLIVFLLSLFIIYGLLHTLGMYYKEDKEKYHFYSKFIELFIIYTIIGYLLYDTNILLFQE